MKKWLHFFLLIIIMLMSCTIPVNAQQTTEVHVYDKMQSSGQDSYMNFFKISNCDVVFHNLNGSSENSFSNLVQSLMLLGVQITSPEDCVSCILAHQTWDEMLRNYASPLIGYFHEGRLTAMTLGITDIGTLEKALLFNGDQLEIFSHHGEYSFKNETLRMELGVLFQQEEGVKISVSNIIWPLVLLAVADSVNPCTFAAFTALLLISLNFLGKKKTALTGLFFIIAVFLSYFILGMGLIYLFARIPYVDKIVAVFGLIIGVLGISLGLRPEFKSLVPKSISGTVDSLIRKTYTSPIASFFLGVVISFTLLPCSSGPYVVGTSLLSTLKGGVYQYFLLAMYNLIFILPLILILIAVLLIREYVRKIKVFRSKNLGTMELISGLLLVLISIYILLT